MFSNPKISSNTPKSEPKPLAVCPPFRPDAPQPIFCASNNATESPFFARFKAAETPVNPPPTTHTSVCSSPFRASKLEEESIVA